MSATVTEISTENPFLFLQPYASGDPYHLHGRENEATSLLALLQWKDMIVVFGKSGVGKTSFINHTLSTRINRVSWLPVRVTRLLDINQSFRQKITWALQAEEIHEIHRDDRVKRGTGNLPVGAEDNGGISVKETVGLVRELNLKWNRPVYLIIDQLEELFLIGSKEEQVVFLKTLRQLIAAKDIQKKIILVLREEHLGFIQEIERILSGVFQDALAINEINETQTEKIFHSLLRDEPANQREFAAHILPFKEKLISSCIHDGKVDVQKLQILLFIVWDKLEPTIFSLETTDVAAAVKEVCEATDPLGDYVNDTVNKKLGENARLLRAPYWFILRNAVSAANTKRPVSVAELYDLMLAALNPKNDTDAPVFQLSIDDVNGWFGRLADRKIMEILPGCPDDRPTHSFYQLKHDSLVAAIDKLDPELVLRFPKKIADAAYYPNPYQGLSQYEQELNENGSRGRRRRRTSRKPNKLYGRAAVIDEYKEFLRKASNNCLVIVGDSGTGKSSLVKGGLLPEMEKAGYQTETKQPGPDLVKFQKEIRDFIYRDENTDEPYSRCLYIDQFEECYTYRKSTVEDKQNFESFLNFLSNEIEQPRSHFKLIVSIRHDYAHDFDRKINQWRSFKKLLRYPNQDEIFDIIVGPAHDSGVDFEPKNLPEIIAADAVNTSYFLPLLSFAMRSLYEREIVERAEEIEKGEQPRLTDKAYDKSGGIVRCLQQKFTETYETLGSDKDLFRQLMPRMIVIKDTIPKAQPLAISRIDFPEPGKVDRAMGVLKKFEGDFFRIRTVVIDGVAEQCFEPLHDSLLVYCDEIRRVISPDPVEGKQRPHQVEVQPKLELALKEWSAADSEEQKIKIAHNLDSELEHLYDFLDNPQVPENWLFSDEMEFLRQSTPYVIDERQLKQKEQDLKIKEAEFLKKQEEMRNRTLKAEMELILAEKHKKEKELTEITLKAELEAQKAKSKRRRLYKWLFVLSSLLFLVAVFGSFYLKEQNHKLERLTNLQEDSIATADSIISMLYTIKQNKDTVASMTQYTQFLKVKDDSNRILIGFLEYAKERLRDSLHILDDTRNRLLKQAASYAMLNRSLIDTIFLLDSMAALNKQLTAENELRYKLGSYYTVAQRTIRSSPALSYRLAQESLKLNADSNNARLILQALEARPGFFESLVVNNVEQHQVSRDGSRILTVESDPDDFGKSLIRVWNTDGAQQGSTGSFPDKFEVADISNDNKMVLLANEGGITLFNSSSGTSRPYIPVGNLQFARFADDDGRFFAITNDKIVVYPASGASPRNISFEIGGAVNNARLSGKELLVVTPNGISQFDVGSNQKVTTKKLAQSFIVQNGTGVLVLEKRWVGNKRDLVLYDSKLRKVWSVKAPEKDFNLVANFASTPDSRYGVIQFNKREYILQTAQRNQQYQQVQTRAPKPEPKGKPDYGNLYFIDLKEGRLYPILTGGGITVNNFMVSATGDSLVEFSAGSIRLYRKMKNGESYTFLNAGTISENSRFQKLSLAGPSHELILSRDVNGQLKLWRYGNAKDLLDRRQLWKFPEKELEKITGVK